MAVQDSTKGAATGVDQGDVKRRNVSGQQNGSYIPKEVEQKMDQKTKEQVRSRWNGAACAARCEALWSGTY